MKRLLSILLTVILIVSAVPLGAFAFNVSAATSGTTGECTWSIKGTTLTISGNGTMSDYGYGYAAFLEGKEAPWSHETVTKVIIEDGVTNIGDYAFCSDGMGSTIEEVIIGNSVTYIGDCAFSFNYSLKELSIPDSVTHIGKRAFEDCRNMQTLNLPKNLISIDDSAFYMCAVDSFTIPASVTYIGDFAFSNGCENIYVDENNSVYSSIGGVLFNKDGTILIQYPSFKTEEKYFVPNTVGKIGKYAFNECWEMDVYIPSSVNQIDNDAFYDCYDVNIYCSKNSIAESYAIENNINYFIVEDTSIVSSIEVIKLPSNTIYENCYIYDFIGTQFKINYFDGASKIVELTESNTKFETGESSSKWWTYVEIDEDILIIDKLWYDNDYHYTAKFNKQECSIEGLKSIESRAVKEVKLDNVTPNGKNMQATVEYEDGTTEEIVIEDIAHMVDFTDSIIYYGRTKNGILAYRIDEIKDQSGTIIQYNIYFLGIDVMVDADDVKNTIIGDLSGDEKINNKDLGLLMQKLNGWDIEINIDAADVNGDGKINNKDYGLLMQYLNGWDVEFK